MMPPLPCLFTVFRGIQKADLASASCLLSSYEVIRRESSPEENADGHEFCLVWTSGKIRGVSTAGLEILYLMGMGYFYEEVCIFQHLEVWPRTDSR